MYLEILIEVVSFWVEWFELYIVMILIVEKNLILYDNDNFLKIFNIN